MKDPASELEWPKAYQPADCEDGIYSSWEDSGFFNPDNLPDRNQKGEPFCIMMPPPNVTGVLHLGHALENALIDTMARFERMRGKRVLIVPGTDHAAVATQAKVEKILMQEGMKNPRQDLGREKLIEKIREFAEQSKITILSQIKKMGTSCDWSRLAYTLDEARSKAVSEMFSRMYADGLIYRGSRVVNWSVKGQSTCSDDEVIHVERPAKLYTFKYSKDFPISISTTRPETKLGDTAVAINPKDERYQDLVGKIFTANVGAKDLLEIKIIAEEMVDQNFGTGALGVTPAHSPIDFAMYEKQKAMGNPIGLIAVIGSDGRMTEAAGTSYHGLTVEEAREKFVSWLRTQGLLEKEEDIVQNVGTSDRFGDVIEAIPMIQWWLDVNKEIPGRGKTLKQLMKEAVTTGLDEKREDKVTITPERFQKSYLDRIENLRDWCLSRQIWWGHRIPVWYKESQIQVSDSAPGEGWIQDEDTLDTWFSSGSWPLSTLGWPGKTNDFATFYPTNWMTMGYEILYLWMMRMILMGTYALKQVPFKEVYVHGILRDESGKKFSKSSGNNLDPLDVMQEYGCDALRWSTLVGSAPGQDSRFYDEKVEGARNLVNKLWNISRFIMTQVEGETSSTKGEETLSDRWIKHRLNEVIASVTEKMQTYQFTSAGEELRDFTWSDVADWYLEIAKVEQGKGRILKHLLESLLKLWHPFMPFVTEEIWRRSGHAGLLMIESWPTVVTVDKEEGSDVSDFEILKLLVSDIRKIRSEHSIDPKKKLRVGIMAGKLITTLVSVNRAWLERLAQASSVECVTEMPKDWVSFASGAHLVGLDVAQAIDREQEKTKLTKELEETRSYVDALKNKLTNEDFASKAPEKVVAGLKLKLKEAEERTSLLEQQLG